MGTSSADVISTQLCRRLVVLLIALVARSASGQDVRGTVRDSASRRPIPGVVLTLLDSSGAVLGRMLTGENGQFHIPTARAIGRIRAQRLGFRLRELRLPPSDTGAVRMDVLMTSLPTLLEPVQVLAGAKCPRRDDDVKTFALLQQARAGLLTAVVARDSNPGKLVVLAYQRWMTERSDRIAGQRVRIDSAMAAKNSFNSVRSAEEFARRGFREERSGLQVFNGPDAEALLGEGFTNGYCFRIADPDRARPNQIGLGFRAADRKAGRVDIDGALWIDTVARKLIDIEYRYVGVADVLASGIRPGGRTGFQEMSNGVVLIDRWVIRLPHVQDDTTYNPRGAEVITHTYTTGESGGELARAVWPDGATWKGSLGTLRVHAVFDNTMPAVGVRVRLLETDYRAVADSNGNFEIAELLPGPYSLDIIDSNFTKLGIHRPSPLTFIAVRDSVLERRVEVESAVAFTLKRCAFDRSDPPRSVLLLGRVLTSDGKPVDGVEITVAYLGRPSAHVYTTGSDGIFHLCLGPDAHLAEMTVWAKRGPKTTEVSLRLSQKLNILRIMIDPP